MPVTVTVEPGGPLVGNTDMTGLIAFTMLNPTTVILAQRIDTINTETYLFKFIPRSKLLLPIYIRLSMFNSYGLNLMTSTVADLKESKMQCKIDFFSMVSKGMTET